MRKAWIAPLPGLLIAGLALASRDVLWHERVVGARGGREVPQIPAHAAIIGLALLSLIYLATLHPDAKWMMGSPRVRQPISDGELGCALGLARAFLLASIYGLAWLLWRFEP